MATPPDDYTEKFQAQFERRWGHLTRPHVRALAWLLDAPDLLDPASALWDGRIASLAAPDPGTADWLAALERDAAPLEAALGGRFYSRLGLYAEKLLAFYFGRQGWLFAHGLQVRANRNDTVGEFDFLLRRGGQLLHWEFATKFYLLAGAPDDHDAAGQGGFNRLVGPNLADTLGVKMRKILDKQLALARHPAAQSLLPQAVAGAQALVKGWLFYPDGAAPRMDGIAAQHNRGFWSTLEQVDKVAGEGFVIMPRMLWLAPLKAAGGSMEVFDRAGLRAALAERFAVQATPVLVALVDENGGWLVERERGFIVPDDWLQQAAARRLAGTLPS
ncbi:MAG TPA: DUF1853 family protein [Janthinobacterium sp.]|nr:DUF1853 family protein [Janthinobacterium sp.]